MPGRIRKGAPSEARFVDAFRFLEAAQGQPRFLSWTSSQAVAGAGIQAEVRARGPGRFRVVRGAVRSHRRASNGAPPPKWIGGFRCVDAPSSASADFPSARFVLPEHRFESGPTPPVATGSIPRVASWRARPDFGAWATGVRRALRLIGQKKISKIVLARTLAGRFERAPSLSALASHVAQAAPESRVFLFEPSPGVGFVSATPELLVARAHGRLRSEALAGTRPRGRTPSEDARLREELLRDPKEAIEHEPVVQHVGETLRRLGYAWIATPRRVRRLSHVQHLATAFEAPTRPGDSALDVAAALHPTPAVAGSPPEAALPLLARLEAADRGWYAGAVGWADATGDGELAVGLRSAHIDGRDVTLHAGAGIVLGATPQAEWDECDAKFRLWTDLLGGRVPRR